MSKRSNDLTYDSWLGLDSRRGRLLAGETNSGNRDGNIQPGGCVEIDARPQVPFRGSRMFVHQPIASSFLIHSLRVGTRETKVETMPIPADAFATRMDRLAQLDQVIEQGGVIEIRIDKIAADLLGAPWTLPLASPGMSVIITVENIDDVPRRFVAGMLGKSES